MKVRCPHCANLFDAAAAGVQSCPFCSKPINVPANPAAGAPVAPVGGVQTVYEGVPWEQPAQGSAWTRFWRTWVGSMGSDAFWRAVPPQGSAKDALLYAWLIGAISSALSFPLTLVQLRGREEFSPERLSELPPALRSAVEQLTHLTEWLQGHALGFSLGSALLGALFVPVGLVIAAAIVHLGALIVGAAGEGFKATFRSVCYSRSPTLFGFIPCVGTLAGIYALILQIWGLARLQRVSGGRAAAAVLLPTLAFACIGCGLLSFLVFAALSAAGAQAH